MLFTVKHCIGVTQPPGKDSKYFFLSLCLLLLLSVCFIAVNNILLQLYLVTILIDLTFCKVQCVGICDERCLFPKKIFTICCLFSLQFLRPLFSDLLIGGLPPNSKHDEKKKMQAEEPSQIGMFLHN